MKLEAYSLYWDNVDARIVEAQGKVCVRFGIPVKQQRIDGMDHGAWIDWVLSLTSADLVLFLDIDCIPLSWTGTKRMVLKAQEGTLVGAEGAANHLDPERTYAGAWYFIVNVNTWLSLGSPSAMADHDHDVAQRFTDHWRANGKPVRLISPDGCEVPLWDLPGRPKAYGIGTAYEDVCYHQFQARGGSSAPFLAKCAQVLNG